LQTKEIRQNTILFEGAAPLTNAIHSDQWSKMTKRRDPNLQL
jgi:hypothetical protein